MIFKAFFFEIFPGNPVQRYLDFLVKMQRSSVRKSIKAPNFTGWNIQPFGIVTEGLFDLHPYDTHLFSILIPGLLDDQIGQDNFRIILRPVSDRCYRTDFHLLHWFGFGYEVGDFDRRLVTLFTGRQILNHGIVHKQVVDRQTFGRCFWRLFPGYRRRCVGDRHRRMVGFNLLCVLSAAPGGLNGGLAGEHQTRLRFFPVCNHCLSLYGRRRHWFLFRKRQPGLVFGNQDGLLIRQRNS